MVKPFSTGIPFVTLGRIFIWDYVLIVFACEDEFVWPIGLIFSTHQPSLERENLQPKLKMWTNISAKFTHGKQTLTKVEWPYLDDFPFICTTSGI